jgi:murein DD-endopeptidase MepM/ murein hydrolase activator NlpD
MRLFEQLGSIRKGLVLVALMTILCSNAAQAQIGEDSTDTDSVWYNDLPVSLRANEVTRLWDTSRMGIIAIPNSGRETLCLQLVDDEHCCFAAPCRGKVTSNFGWRNGRVHAGIDIDLETGDPVYAAFDGIVRQSGWNRGYGYFVIISHFNGLETLYGHLSVTRMSVLQPVKSGQLLGYGGNTGRSRGSHLHFEVRYFGKAVNPKLLIDFDDYSLHTDTFNVGNVYTFSKSNFINEASSIVAVMNDSVYRQQEQKYEASRLKTIKANERNRKEIEKKKREKQAKLEKEKLKKAKVYYHTVKKGDTLYALSKKYGKSVDEICKMNKMKPTDILDLGRKLRVK